MAISVLDHTGPPTRPIKGGELPSEGMICKKVGGKNPSPLPPLVV